MESEAEVLNIKIKTMDSSFIEVSTHLHATVGSIQGEIHEVDPSLAENWGFFGQSTACLQGKKAQTRGDHGPAGS